MDDKRKNNFITRLNTKMKETDEAPCNEGKISKPLQSKIDEKPNIKILQRPNQGQKKIKSNATPRSNIKLIKDEDQ